MHWIDTAGRGKVTDAGTRGNDAMNGNAVMYDIGKILTVGGAPAYDDSDASAAAYTVDITGNTPTVRRVADMAAARALQNSVVLPDGTVVVVGGQTRAVLFSDQNSVLEPELWNPATGRFTKLAPMAAPRNYHSVANLLPDGTVFSGGGGLCGKCATNHPDGQILVPPYLLNPDGTRKARPAITSAPSTAGYGSTITIGTDRAVKGFALMRLSAVTHSVDNDQRRVPLSATTASPTSYRAAIPSDAGIAPPGNYLLFALDNAGTPSVAAPIRIS
ncbi:galactose oxidase-like domain-containing protein [Lentzea sp. NPDC051838]|uniref:galactose oxidase-like domain-containing protein n=1 Tax=Lentzea sp. NPDC051838 TaxID=3154849 RepID=UPI0034496432